MQENRQRKETHAQFGKSVAETFVEQDVSEKVILLRDYNVFGEENRERITFDGRWLTTNKKKNLKHVRVVEISIDDKRIAHEDFVH